MSRIVACAARRPLRGRQRGLTRQAQTAAVGSPARPPWHARSRRWPEGRAPSHALCPFAAADYNLTPRDRPKLFVQCADAPRAALLEREAGLVAALASAEQVGPGVLVSATGLGLGVGFYP